ncbi:MAG: rhamnulokinase [Chloroflexi bacterium]|nr:rhamnulokinase [Chloroflexota bacterium]
MAQNMHFLAVDLGASSGRVVLGQWDGTAFDLQEVHRFPNRPINVLGHWHTDVLALWSEIKTGLARYAAQPRTGDLAGIGIDTWGVDFALLDKSGHLLGNPYQYRDGRTNGMFEKVLSRVPRQEIFEQTGIQFIQINTLYQIYSMVLDHDPQLENAASFLMLPDLFNYWLTGRQAAEYTDATTSQMFHSRERRWATELLAKLTIPTGILPPIITPGTILGKLLPEVAAETGLPENIPVIAPGTHDTASAVAGIPHLDARSAYISSGTWSLMGVEIPEPVLNEQALAYNFTNEGGVAGTIRLLKNITGLWLVQECQRHWAKEDMHFTWEQLLEVSAAVPAFRSLVDPDAPDFLNPTDMPAAIRAYCQRTGQPMPDSVGAVIRCCLESLALKYRYVLQRLESLTGYPLDAIRIVGGGSLNRQLCQMTADACQRPVVAGPAEATALGNVLMQAIASGNLPDITTGRRILGTSVPQQKYTPHGEAIWEEAFNHFILLL